MFVRIDQRRKYVTPLGDRTRGCSGVVWISRQRPEIFPGASIQLRRTLISWLPGAKTLIVSPSVIATTEPDKTGSWPRAAFASSRTRHTTSAGLGVVDGRAVKGIVVRALLAPCETNRLSVSLCRWVERYHNVCAYMCTFESGSHLHTAYKLL